MTFFPFGSTRTGSVNTAKEFTGQRLDSTGLYYYNARYYDPNIGRFISVDSAIKQNNPQTLNGYSYCVNNPLKYADPSGLFYLVVGGSGSKAGDEGKYAWMVNQLLQDGEQWAFLPDNDPESWYAVRDAAPREQQIIDYLNSNDLTDIKIIGFSEGAAATGKFLNDLAANPNIVKNSSEIQGAALLECPTGISDLMVNNFDDSMLYNLPKILNFPVLDIWNRASIVHDSGTLPRWNKTNSFSYDSRPWWAQGLEYLGAFAADYALGWAGGAGLDLLYQLAMTGKVYHGDILTDPYAVGKMNAAFN
jgi:RHS repeat-associated protein